MENCRTKRTGLSYLTLLIAGAVLMTAPISAWAGHYGNTTTGHASSTDRKAEDVRNTLHNLSTSNIIAGSNIGSGASATTEVCVFCHTPHGADASFAGAPLWNRALPSGTVYTTYNAPNIDVAPGQPQGVSLACLSCHDGGAALDAFVNGPGSGRFYTLGNTATTNTIGPGTGSFVDASNSMSETDRGTEANYAALSGGAPFPNLTTNLSDDHPISFAMPATDPQFDDALANLTADGNINLVGRTGLSGPVDKRDAIRLYPVAGAASPAGTWVECASCHNPHAPRPLMLRLPLSSSGPIEKGGDTTTVGDVLGISNSTLIADDPNAGSAVCLSCHEK